MASVNGVGSLSQCKKAPRFIRGLCSLPLAPSHSAPGDGGKDPWVRAACETWLVWIRVILAVVGQQLSAADMRGVEGDHADGSSSRPLSSSRLLDSMLFE